MSRGSSSSLSHEEKALLSKYVALRKKGQKWNNLQKEKEEKIVPKERVPADCSSGRSEMQRQVAFNLIKHGYVPPIKAVVRKDSGFKRPICNSVS